MGINIIIIITTRISSLLEIHFSHHFQNKPIQPIYIYKRSQVIYIQVLLKFMYKNKIFINKAIICKTFQSECYTEIKLKINKFNWLIKSQ